MAKSRKTSSKRGKKTVAKKKKVTRKSTRRASKASASARKSVRTSASAFKPASAHGPSATLRSTALAPVATIPAALNRPSFGAGLPTSTGFRSTSRPSTPGSSSSSSGSSSSYGSSSSFDRGRPADFNDPFMSQPASSNLNDDDDDDMDDADDESGMNRPLIVG